MSKTTEAAKAKAAPKPSAPRDHLLVGVLKLLPMSDRTTFCYWLLAAMLIAGIAGLMLAPTLTVTSVSGIGLYSWVARLLGR